MPDPLDPTHAIVSAFTDSFARFGGFLAASLGAHLLGSQVHALPILLTTPPPMNIGALLDLAAVEAWHVLMTWLGGLGGSFMVPAAWPFLAVLLWQAARLRGETELFQILFWTALAQPPLSFIMAQRAAPLAGSSLAAGLGALVLSVAVVAGGMLWWRHTTEHAPDSAAAGESEL